MTYAYATGLSSTMAIGRMVALASCLRSPMSSLASR